MKDPNPETRRPANGAEIAAIVLVSVAFAAMLLASLIEDFSIYHWSILFFILSWVALLVIHEFGHALMARLLGWKVDLVSIGAGKLLSKRKILGATVEFRSIPLSGFVLPRPRNLSFPRLKSFFIYAAGPGIEWLLVLLILGTLGSETLFQLQPQLALIAAQSFCAAAVFGIFINLVPLPMTSDTGQTACTDGLGMILCWTRPAEYYAKLTQDESGISQ